MSYVREGLYGNRQHILIGLGYLVRGLGVTNEQLGLEHCSGGDMDLGKQWACAQRNMAKQIAYDESPEVQARAANLRAASYAFLVQQADAGNTFAQTALTTTPAPPVPPPPTSGTPQLSFTSSRGGTTLYPGDTWSVQITGARPSASVVVAGGRNGVSDSNTMGQTDSAGRFALSGTFTSDDIGSWREAWAVGGVPVGSFSFTVKATPATGTPPVVPPPGGGNGAGNGDTLSFDSIPQWAWLAVAGVGALFLFGGKR